MQLNKPWARLQMSLDHLRSATRIAALLVLGAMVVLSGCVQAQQASGGSALSSATASAPTAESVSLLLQGYNYTDHYIDSFSVNGQGGGNIFESGPSSGGGKSACCVSWWTGSRLPIKIKVKWVAGYCVYREQNPYSFGERFIEKRRSLWKEQEAFISEAVVVKPRALEIHFYRDGHIEAAVTAGDSPPRVALQRDADYNRPGVSQEFPRCADEPK
jgi:Protein of unknown function (DUF3304)